MNHQDAIKARLRPSAAERWLRCGASAQREALLPRTESDYAKEGIVFHQVVAAYLLDPASLREAVGERIDGVLVDLEMVRCAEDCEDYATALNPDRSTWLIEHELDLEGVLPNNGTSDLVIIDWAAKRMHVIDWKYGRGVRVNAHKNPQLMTYGLGALRVAEQLGEIEEIVLHIKQPRIDHVDTYVTNPIELTEHEQKLQAGVEVALSADPPYAPGSWCKFCEARGQCTALARESLKVLQVEGTVGDETIEELLEAVPTASNALTPTQVSAVLERAEMLEDWLGAVRAFAQATIENGGIIPGWKLVEGRKGNREWASEAAVLDIAKRAKKLSVDDYMPRSLASPSALEKAVGKARFNELFAAQVERRDGKNVLAREDDKRPAIVMQDMAELFGDPEALDDLLS